MNDEKIKVRNTESGDLIEVVVYKKTADRIEVVVGKGVHNVKCTLRPNRMNTAFAGNIMGRELVYERSPAQVQEDLDRVNPRLKQYKAR
jgi:hypothetical protein